MRSNQILGYFPLFCLLIESPKDDVKRLEDNAFNYNAVIFNGRDKGLILRDGAREITIETWANEILEQLQGLANFLDTIEKSKRNRASLQNMSKLVSNPEFTPSGKMLVEMTEKEVSFLEFGLRKSEENYKHYLNLDLDMEELGFLKRYEGKPQESERASTG